MTASEAANHAPATPASSAVQPATLQGWSADLTALDDASRADIIEKAFDFRGDITITLASGKTVVGYLFDRRRARTLAESVLRLLPAEGDQPVAVPFADVRGIEFGKDAAHGKTWENWVKRYIEKKTKGEAASIEAEVL